MVHVAVVDGSLLSRKTFGEQVISLASTPPSPNGTPLNIKPHVSRPPPIQSQRFIRAPEACLGALSVCQEKKKVVSLPLREKT